MISSMADDSPLPSLTSESQPDGFRTASVRPECHPLYPSPSSSESMLASKAFLPFPTLPPRSPKRRANKRKQTKNRGEPSGLQEEGRGSPGQGNGVHLVNASGLETGNGGGRPKEAMRAWRDSQEEGERAVMQLGTNLLLLYQILSQSIGVC